METAITFSIVVPCYNEEKNIPLLLNRFREVMNRSDVEIIVVNNGSTDHSEKILCELIPSYPFARVVKVEKNQGYGYGIVSGLNEARGTVLGWTHADMQTDPGDVLRACELWQQHPGEKRLIKGVRHNRPWIDRLFTYGMQRIASYALGVPLSDINAQPKLFSRSFYETYVQQNAPHDFSLDLFILYQALLHGYAIDTIPVDFAKRLHGQAKGGGSWKTRIRLIRRTWRYIWTLK